MCFFFFPPLASLLRLPCNEAAVELLHVCLCLATVPGNVTASQPPPMGTEPLAAGELVRMVICDERYWSLLS